MIRIGILGVGGITRMLHIPELLALPNVYRIEAVADVNKETALQMQKELGCKYAYTNYKEVLQLSEIDAVIVGTPHDTHEEICIAALKAGKHVFVEKPFARTVAECDAIMAAQTKANKVILVGHNERYMPPYAEIKKIVDSGTLGRIFSARADHFQNFNPPQDSWWRKKEIVGGGCVIGSGVHRLDLLLWFLGEVDEVSSRQNKVDFRSEAEIANCSVIQFKNGAISEFFCNWGIFNYMYYESLAIFGEDGMVCFDGNKLLTSTKDHPELAEITPAPCPTQLEHFSHCILKGTKPLVGAEEGRNAVKLVEKLYESAQRKTAVKF